MSRDLSSTAAHCVPLDAGCEVPSDWAAVRRKIVEGLERHYSTVPNKMEGLGRSGVAGTSKMGDGRGAWLKEMKDFEEVRSVQVNLMLL